MTSTAVHREGVVAFASLLGEEYAYKIDYADVGGRVWLQSRATEREWECVIANRDAFAADPTFREQFDMELELLQLALQQDPRARKSVTCKHVVLTKTEGDDLVMQLNQKVYARLNPNMGAMVQFKLKYVAGTGAPLPASDPSLSLAQAAPVKKTSAPAPPRAKPVRLTKADKLKDSLPRLREENKALQATNKALSVDLKRARAEILALRKENLVVGAAKEACVVDIAALERENMDSLRQWKAENDALRRENRQFQAQHAALIKMGGMHEFQRQHIEHLRRKIYALELQTGQAVVEGQFVQEMVPDRVHVVTSSGSLGRSGGEGQHTQIQRSTVAKTVAAADQQSKRRRLSDK